MNTLEKVDLLKLHKAEYCSPRKPVVVDTRPAAYLAISGQGAPGGRVFSDKIGALYGVAFTVKMTRKFGGRQDYTICKLECQWFFDPGRECLPADKEQWRWKLLIRTPDFVTREEVAQAVVTLLDKGKGAETREVALENLDEGRCVQMLHVGPYEREPETIGVMQAFAASQGLRLTGPHHEIYLSDPRRVQAEKLKTILRAPARG